MNKDGLRYRGLSIVVDTTQAAEFDIQGYQISDKQIEQIAHALKSTAFSENDRVFGDVRVRKMFGYEVAYVVGRDKGNVVITIGAVEHIGASKSMADFMEYMGKIDLLRGATGI